MMPKPPVLAKEPGRHGTGGLEVKDIDVTVAEL